MGEPEGVPVVRWRCVNPSCRKSYASRSRARAHAAECVRDPDNRSCLTCANFVGADPGEPEVGYFGTDPACEVGLTIGRPMPRNCPSWASEGADQ